MSAIELTPQELAQGLRAMASKDYKISHIDWMVIGLSITVLEEQAEKIRLLESFPPISLTDIQLDLIWAVYGSVRRQLALGDKVDWKTIVRAELQKPDNCTKYA